MPSRSPSDPVSRAPAPSERPRAPHAAAVELRLAIGRDGLGMELGSPAKIACAEITELAVSLPGMRFPLDVSGGVSRFRHRRGVLQRVAIDVGARAIERWAAPKLRGLVSPETPEVWVALRADGATIAIAAAEDPLAERATPHVLAFDVAAIAEADAVELCVVRARGTGLAEPATALAIAALGALVGDLASRAGACFTVTRLPERIGRVLLPDAGARAPSGESVRFTSLAAHDDTWILHASAGGVSPAPSEAALRARESAKLCADADDARARADFVRARELDLLALERAPKHAEVSRRIAEIDLREGGRAEAALATMVEAGHGADAGLLVGELFAESGDVEAAIASFARAGDAEPAPVLGARAFERAAELAADHHEALELLDRALARAPRLARIRWARMRRRLAAGRLEDAMADVEQLEATARGAHAKYVVWRRAGDSWAAAGLHGDTGTGVRGGALGAATTMFERALRYAPDASDAIAGLGAALVAEGRAARGTALLARAVERASARGEEPSGAIVKLARALAEALGDLPAAIARVRSVADVAPEAAIARGLEGRWRARLGDLGGASLAFARLRELASDGDETFALLLEAAAMEDEEREDLFASQRHLAAALRMRPRDARALASYRSIGERIAKGLPPGAQRRSSARTEPPDAPYEPPTSRLDVPLPSAAPAVPEDAESRVDELTRKLHADPSRDDVADELASLLRALGRSHELLALLSARLEDATPERRAMLLPTTRATLESLAREADDAGHASEAQLFRDFLAILA
jgi:hypothetical protein